MPGPERAVLITGTVGVGKSTVAIEAGLILEKEGVAHAVLDLDWLGWMHPRPPNGYSEFIASNLTALLPRFRAAGARHLILCRAVRHDSEIAMLSQAVAPASLTVVVLTAPPDVVRARLEERDQGRILATHLAESAVIDEVLQRLTRVDARISTDESVETIARRVLTSAGLL